MVQRIFQLRSFALGLVLCLVCFVKNLPAQPQPFAPFSVLPVTNGLIHWWPNLFDAQDEITGQEGKVMGVLPEVSTNSFDDTAFNAATGWVQFPEASFASNAFTLAIWIRSDKQPNTGNVVLGLHGSEGRWLLRQLPSEPAEQYGIETRRDGRTDGIRFVLPQEGWHQVTVTKASDGTVLVWRDGVRQAEGRWSFDPATRFEWLTVGNEWKGDLQWHGRLRDFCVFERVLTAGEVRVLHAVGTRPRPTKNSKARRMANAKGQLFNWSTNVVRRSVEEFSYRRYTTEDGLPGNHVQCLLQTRDGYLWMGTEDGLARFDGRDFRSFTAENNAALAMTGNDISSLSEASDGTVWAGVYGGLLRIRGTEVTAFTNGLPERFVLQAEPAGGGAVWVAGFGLDHRDRGPCRVRRYHPDTGTCSAEVVVPGHVRRLAPVVGGIWMATEDPEQLLFWDAGSLAPVVVCKLSGAPVRIQARSETPAPGVTVHGWQDTAREDRRWIEVKVNDHGPTFYWLCPTPKNAANASRGGDTSGNTSWLGARPGLARLADNRIEQIEFVNQPSPLEVVCVTGNREGGVWIGTEQDGLHLVQEKLVRVFTTRDGLSGNDMRSICTSSDVVLAGSAEGLDVFEDGRWRRADRDSARPISQILSVTRDRFGTIWFGRGHAGRNALACVVSNQVGSVNPPGVMWEDPATLLVTSRGQLWTACNLGLTWVDLAPPVFAPRSDEAAIPGSKHGRLKVGEDLPRTEFRGLVEDRDGSIWAGTIGSGLLHVRDAQVETFTTKDGLPSDFCVPVRRDDSGALWLVSQGALTRRAQNRFKVIRPSEGLPNDLLFDFIEDELGHFWLPGQRGVHRLERRELEAFFDGRTNRVRSLTLGVRDGLLTPECTGMHYPITGKTPDGHIWVATRNGVATFDPRRVRLNTEPLPTVIEELFVNRRVISDAARIGSGRPLKLQAGSGERLEIQYTATSLVAADRIRFRYKLEGYDTEWSPETNLRLAFYTNLRPGEYRFRVKAANAHGVWNDHDTAMSFVILPYFWQTRIFYITSIIAMLASAAGLHWRRMVGQHQIQELKHCQVLTAEKERIAADMHDELGATLTQIAILSEVAKRQSNPAEARSTLDRMSQAARDVTSRMSDLVWATNPRNDTLDNLVAYLREQAASQFENTTIKPHLVFPESFSECHVSATFRRNLLLVMKEALHNVIKHSQASEVHISIGIAASTLVLRIQDNGRGFEPSLRKRAGNGLGNMQKRIRDLNGQFSLRSVAGKGTCIEINLPIEATTTISSATA